MSLTRPILISVALLAGVVAVGVAGLMVIEGWSLLEAAWMVLITLTTIGFGEIHPLSDAGRVFTMGLIVAGVSVGTYAMGQVTTLIVEGQLPAWLRQERRRRRMKELDGHVIVVGYGRLGRTVVDEMLANGIPVALIEKDPALVKEAEETRGLPAFVGDGADDDLLRAAGITRARGVAVAVSSGAEAVYTTLSARQLAPKGYIVTRVADAEHAVKARRAGADEVVSPHTMGGWRMAHALVRPHTSSFLDLAMLSSHQDIQLDEVEVPERAMAVGHTVRRLAAHDRYGVLIIAIRRRDGTLVPAPRSEEVVQAGDVLMLIGPPVQTREFVGSIDPARRG